jgi:hypothetical protein
MANVAAPVPSLRRLPDRSAKNETLPEPLGLADTHVRDAGRSALCALVRLLGTQAARDWFRAGSPITAPVPSGGTHE